jgi:hypothetical protein
MLRHEDVKNLEGVAVALDSVLQACQFALGDLMDIPLGGDVIDAVVVLDSASASAGTWSRAVRRIVDASPPF